MGEVLLVDSHSGITNSQLQPRFVAAHDSTNLELDFSTAAVELDRVVVVGGRVEQSIEDVAGSISLMTGEDIENEMVSDMSQLFRYEPGIDIRARVTVLGEGARGRPLAAASSRVRPNGSVSAGLTKTPPDAAATR